MPVILWWVRRDLRLHDNQALQGALSHHLPVVPVFVLDPQLVNAPDAGEKRLAFLFAGLALLDEELRMRGGRLILRWGDPGVELTRLAAESGAEAIYAEADPWPYARARDAAVAAHLPLRLTAGLTVRPFDAIVKANGAPYTVFTPYSRAWKALPLPSTASLKAPPARFEAIADINTLALPGSPSLPPDVPLPPGEAEGLLRLRAFAGGSNAAINSYAQKRNRLDLEGTSQLSPYLRFGMVSGHRAALAAVDAMEAAESEDERRGADTWLTELAWRDFYHTVLYHYPHVLTQEFQERMRAISWRHDDAAYEAWCEGRTGYPIVDAGMRQLVQTGWMHNRARMIVASFLVKDLLIDWRLGERFFMRHLLDADPAANNGGWQWTAGVGTDAAPYFRVFNPTLQSEKFDPHGDYIRRWVPELARVPVKYIHEPSQMSIGLQQELGCLIGHSYPMPIVDHAMARRRALDAYKA